MQTPASNAPIWPIVVSFTWGIMFAALPGDLVARTIETTFPLATELPVVALCVGEGVFIRLRVSRNPLHWAYGGLLVGASYLIGITAAMAILDALGMALFMAKAYVSQAILLLVAGTLGAL